MYKAGIIVLLLGLCWFSGPLTPLYAQEAAGQEQDADYDNYNEEDEEDDDDDSQGRDISIETDWDGYMAELYSKGDQTFTISVGVNFPAGIYYSGFKKVDPHNWSAVGGAGSLAYTRFLSSHFFVGAEIGVSFNFTLGENTLFIIPIGIRAGWQFLFHRFEFPVTFVMGIAPQRYVNFSYLGFFIKTGGSAFFRFSPEWSFGLNTDWHWYPQWPRTGKAMYANLLTITLAARYHF